MVELKHRFDPVCWHTVMISVLNLNSIEAGMTSAVNGLFKRLHQTEENIQGGCYGRCKVLFKEAQFWMPLNTTKVCRSALIANENWKKLAE